MTFFVNSWNQHNQNPSFNHIGEFLKHNYIFLVIVDAADACNMAVFGLTGSGISPSWDIKVTQYTCGDEMAGINSFCLLVCSLFVIFFFTDNRTWRMSAVLHIKHWHCCQFQFSYQQRSRRCNKYWCFLNLFEFILTFFSLSATHLSNQCYAICFRQNAAKCGICFQPVVLGTIDTASVK